MRVVALIPARGGSKGVPGKNLRLLGGRPLVAHTVEHALGARSLHRVVLSTDDARIAEAGREAGAEVPFLRPAELARDETAMIEVVLHALDWLAERGDPVDALCLLQPTTPFRRPDDVDRCVELLAGSGADTVLSLRRIPDEHNPHWAWEMDGSGRVRLATGEAEPISRRQELPVAYHRDGAVYVTRAAVIRRRRSLYGDVVVGYESPDPRWVNIDTEEDWRRAEALLGQGAAADA
jgi:CMP-N-acetylneuraminic acid synthetase